MADADPDPAAADLESYIAAELGVEVVDTEVLSDEINLIVAISTAEEREAYVLRRPNALRHTGLFNALDKEYRLLQRLRETPIPTPIPVLFCDDGSVIGDQFFVTTYLDGTAIPLGSDLPERFRDARSRRTVATLLIDTLAEIHSLDVDLFEDACERHSPPEQVARALDRLDAARDVTGRERPRLRSVGEWLQHHPPPDSTTTLVHGDYRPSNVLFGGSDRPEITGVLDWETAMLGDPLTELGYLLLRWRDDGDPTPDLDGIEARYSNDDAIEELRDANERGLCPFTSKPGSPSRRELVVRYEQRTGITFEHDRFYRAHAAFMLAAVWEDIRRHRIEAGGASRKAPYVDYVAMIAEGIIDGDS